MTPLLEFFVTVPNTAGILKKKNINAIVENNLKFRVLDIRW